MNVICQQIPKTQFVEFVIDGESSPELMRKINFEFQGISDFQATRLDIPTERFFAVLKAGKTLDQEWFKKKFAEYGLTIHCYHTGNLGEAKYQHMAKKDCPELNSK